MLRCYVHVRVFILQFIQRSIRYIKKGEGPHRLAADSMTTYVNESEKKNERKKHKVTTSHSIDQLKNNCMHDFRPPPPLVMYLKWPPSIAPSILMQYIA